MNPVRMYTTKVCPYCRRAKALLEQRGVTAIDEVRITLAGPADFDGDADVDIDDVARFAACLTGPNAGGGVGNCESMDLDLDGDVDNSDFGLVQRCLSGALIPADPNCANSNP